MLSKWELISESMLQLNNKRNIKLWGIRQMKFMLPNISDYQANEKLTD